MNTVVKAALLSFVLLCTGCASIVSSSSQSMNFKSVPESAQIIITNRAGIEVHTGQTPVTVSLKKGAGYFKPEIYQVRFAKAGYATKTFEVKAVLSGWYFGNVIFGGLIGLLAVDPITGAMYKFNVKDVHAVLEANHIDTTTAEHSLTVVLTENIDPELLARASKITP